MKNVRLLNVIQVLIIVLLILTLFFSSRSSQKEIKKLIHEVNQVTDSLKQIHLVYNNLEVEYNRIYFKLDSTRIRFNTFRNTIDSVAHCNRTNINKINLDIKRLIEKEITIAPFKNVTDTFRFK